MPSIWRLNVNTPPGVMLAPPYRSFPAWASYAAPIAIAVGSVIGSVMLVNAA